MQSLEIIHHFARHDLIIRKILSEINNLRIHSANKFLSAGTIKAIDNSGFGLRNLNGVVGGIFTKIFFDKIGIHKSLVGLANKTSQQGHHKQENQRQKMTNFETLEILLNIIKHYLYYSK